MIRGMELCRIDSCATTWLVRRIRTRARISVVHQSLSAFPGVQAQSLIHPRHMLLMATHHIGSLHNIRKYFWFSKTDNKLEKKTICFFFSWTSNQKKFYICFMNEKWIDWDSFLCRGSLGHRYCSEGKKTGKRWYKNGSQWVWTLMRQMIHRKPEGLLLEDGTFFQGTNNAYD